MNAGRRADGSRSRWLIPEVVQTSAMDCGPAALKALLEGFRLPASYSRLRVACQTDVDGTSIDTLEELACQLGLDAEQVMVPRDHVLPKGSHHHPALVVVVGPNGATHFVALWRTTGPLVQVMDPARGRVWMSRADVVHDLYQHRATVSADAWRAWAGTPAFLDPLRERLRALGLSKRDSAARLERAQGDPSWRGLATLDAAVRMLSSLRTAQAMRRKEALASLSALTAADRDSSEVIPEHCWSVLPSDQDGHLTFSGAVLIRVRGRAAMPLEETSDSSVASLRVRETARPLRAAFAMLRKDGLLTPAIAAGAALVAVAGLVLEATLLRSVLDITRELRLPEQGLLAGVLLAAFSLALLGAEWVLGRAERRAGHHLEARLRVALLTKIPRLADVFLQSRPISDLLERAHGIHIARALPRLGFRMLRLAMELVITTAAIAWLAPDAAWLASGAALAAAALPLFGHRVLAARDLKVRTHAGALQRFHLDALLGRTAIEAHNAGRALETEHEHLLREWTRASLSLQRGTVAIEAVQMLVGFGLAGWILIGRLGGGAETAGLLLLAYWMLNLPALGYELALHAREYPAHRNTLLRLLDVLDTPAVSVNETARAAHESELTGAAIHFRQVVLRLGGQPVLDIDLRIPPGSHVAIVGPSGAGKSTLAALLLGWYEPSQGQLIVDDQVVDATIAQALRQQIAWVDPSVQVWNRSLLDNLTNGTANIDDVAPVLDAAALIPVLSRLPDGMATTLGEGGSLLSAGEAQRVRLGRAMLRPNARLTILDEPFLGLERERRRSLLAEARKRWNNSTLLYVTHDVAEARGFDRVLVMERGVIAEDGDPRVLAQTMGSRYRRLLQAQEAAYARFATPEWKRMRLEDGRLVQEYGNAAKEHSA